MSTNNAINNVISSWVAYTPTFTGFGTATSISFFSRRVGDVLEIMGKFTAGTTTATEARITIGYNGTSANVNSSSTVITSIQVCGDSAQSFSGATFVSPLIESNVSYLTFGMQAAASSGLTKVNGSTLMSTGQTLSFLAEVPVTTWV